LNILSHTFALILRSLQPRTEVLLQELVKFRVDSKAKLLQRWKANPACMFVLLSESFFLYRALFFLVGSTA